MKYILLVVVICWGSPVIADDALPSCGEVVRESYAAAADSLWLLRGELADSRLGKISVSLANGTRREFSFTGKDETLKASFEWQNTAYLITQHPRGYGLYAFSGGGSPSLTLIRKENLRSEVGGRVLFSYLTDFYFDPQRRQVTLLNAFEIFSVGVPEFVQGSTPAYARTPVPVNFEQDAPRPIALVPWEAVVPGASLIFEAGKNQDTPWNQPYGFNLYRRELDFDWKDQVTADYLANVHNRNSSDSAEWLVAGREFIDTQTGAKISFSAYPDDIFRSGDDMLVNLYEKEVQFFRKGQAVCRVFDAEAIRSLMIYRQDTPSGPQKVFLALTNARKLLKMALFENSRGDLLLQ